MHRLTPDHFAACLLGGALGDALGAPVEFDTLPAIRERYGPSGITDPAECFGRVGAITDDTQMTLFTAEGLIRAAVRASSRGSSPPTDLLVHGAYLRWLDTQGVAPAAPPPPQAAPQSSWLCQVQALRSRRNPGGTCLSALRSGKRGTPAQPLNHSKGCGTVMRTAPVGLVSDQPFNLAVAVGALTHGHPTGYLAAGCLAQIIWSIARDTPLPVAIDSALEKLRTHPGHEETSRACELAVALADSAPAAPETIEQIGAGWVAEEALAIALFSALAAESFEHGVRLAVNHGGDSDSTGAIAGNLLGLLHGRAALPSQWLNFLELRQEIEQVATDLYDACIARSPERLSRLSARYPGY